MELPNKGTDAACCNCAFSRRIGRTDSLYCQRNPPQITPFFLNDDEDETNDVIIAKATKYPVVDEGDFCGEWKQAVWEA